MGLDGICKKGTGMVNMEIQGEYQWENCIKRGRTLHESYWSVSSKDDYV